jgi:sorbitol-specific phosphotransferase system component IIBC
MGDVANVLAFPSGVALVGSAVDVASPPSSTKVEISVAAKTAAAADVVPAGLSMSELAQALLVALLLQLLERRSFN